MNSWLAPLDGHRRVHDVHDDRRELAVCVEYTQGTLAGPASITLGVTLLGRRF